MRPAAKYNLIPKTQVYFRGAHNVDRLSLFRNAKREVESLRVRFPEAHTLTSIVHQLEYLISLAGGQTSDCSRLPDIILGVQTAREVEALDSGTAETLYAVSAEVSKL